MSTAPMLPARRGPSNNMNEDQSDTPSPPTGIAARIAALKLNQVGLNPNGANGNGSPAAPITPNRRPALPARTSSDAAAANPPSSPTPSVGKRPPPPPPAKSLKGDTTTTSINVSPPLPGRKWGLPGQTATTPTPEEIKVTPSLPPRRPPLPIRHTNSTSTNEEPSSTASAPVLPIRRERPPIPLPGRRVSVLSQSQSEEEETVSTPPPPSLPPRRGAPPLPVRKNSVQPQPDPEPEPEPVEEEENEDEPEPEPTPSLPPRRMPPVPGTFQRISKQNEGAPAPPNLPVRRASAIRQPEPEPEPEEADAEAEEAADEPEQEPEPEPTPYLPPRRIPPVPGTFGRIGMQKDISSSPTPPILPIRRTASNTSQPQDTLPTPMSSPPHLPTRRSTTQAATIEEFKASNPPPPPPTATTTATTTARRLPPPVSTLKRPPTPPPEPEPEPEISADVYNENGTDGYAEECLKCHDFSQEDRHSSLFPRQSVSTLSSLASSLTSPFPSLTSKARAIFTWLHHNVAYDTYSFFNNCVKHQSPDDTLRSGLAVCDGYAGLFERLATLAGLEAVKVTGHGKGYGYVALEPDARCPPFEMNHAWNAVKLDDGQWHLVDACWGAGPLVNGQFEKRFNPNWFTYTNIEFGMKHYPEKKAHLFREDGKNVTWEEYFVGSGPPPKVYGSLGEKGYDEWNLLPSDKYVQRGSWVTIHVEKQCWHMERRDWWTDMPMFVEVVSSTSNKSEKIAMERDPGGPGHGWTKKVYIPSDGQVVNLQFVNMINGREPVGMQPEELKVEMSRMRGMGWGGLAQWECT